MNQERKKKLVKYILPTVFSFCCTFLYVIVDGIFVGQGVGVDALGAVNIAIPFTILITALATLMSIGGVTITAIRLGRGDTEGANQAFLHATTISLGIGILLMLIGMLFSRQIAAISGANDTFLDLTATYIFYYSAFALPFVAGVILQGFVRNDGSPILVSIAVITGAVLNVFLDWLFVFPLQMGIKGAAIASGLGQISGLAILLSHFIRKKGVLRFKRFSFSPALSKKICKRGIPEMISQFGTPVMTLCMNYILIERVGDLSVSVFSVLSYLTSFSIGIFIGISGGLQPLIGQSYGEKDEESLRWYFRAGQLLGLVSSVLIYGIFVLFAGPICSLFNPDPELVEAATLALPQFAWAFVIISQNLVISAYFYSTKRTGAAVLLALCRCFLFVIPCILLLPLVFGNGIIWYSLGISECLSLLVGVILLRWTEQYGIQFR